MSHIVPEERAPRVHISGAAAPTLFRLSKSGGSRQRIGISLRNSIHTQPTVLNCSYDERFWAKKGGGGGGGGRSRGEKVLSFGALRKLVYYCCRVPPEN